MRYILLILLMAFPTLAFSVDCQSVGPSRSLTPNYLVSCMYLADTATGTGVRTTCTSQVLEDVDEWYFFVSEDTGTDNYNINIENFFETDDDPTVIGALTDENPEFRWLRSQDGNLHKSLRANITVLDDAPTDVDVQVCFIRYLHQ